MAGPSTGQLADEDADLAKLVGELLDEVKALRLENARIIEQLEEGAKVMRRLGVQDGNRHRLVKASEIAFVTADDYGLNVHTTDKNVYTNFMGLGEMEERFKDDLRLMRIHKSFIVNLNQVRTVANTSGGRDLTFYTLDEKAVVPLAYGYLEEFQRRLGVGPDAG